MWFLLPSHDRTVMKNVTPSPATNSLIPLWKFTVSAVLQGLYHFYLPCFSFQFLFIFVFFFLFTSNILWKYEEDQKKPNSDIYSRRYEQHRSSQKKNNNKRLQNIVQIIGHLSINNPERERERGRQSDGEAHKGVNQTRCEMVSTNTIPIKSHCPKKTDLIVFAYLKLQCGCILCVYFQFFVLYLLFLSFLFSTK